ncbi:hypothetical protein [Endozoicomonas sp.]|uniref:hypothetical protein n=1 Tax=Endozoicomonas sp. TaxID=1892382 RepID=UPI003D9BE0FA
MQIPAWRITRRNKMAYEPNIIPVIHDRKGYRIVGVVEEHDSKKTTTSLRAFGSRTFDGVEVLTSHFTWRQHIKTDFFDPNQPDGLRTDQAFLKYQNIVMRQPLRSGGYHYIVLDKSKMVQIDAELHPFVEDEELKVNCESSHLSEEATLKCHQLLQKQHHLANLYYHLLEHTPDLKVPMYELIDPASPDEGHEEPEFIVSEEQITAEVQALYDKNAKDKRELMFDPRTFKRFDQLSMQKTQRILYAFLQAYETFSPNKQNTDISDVIPPLSHCGWIPSNPLLMSCYKQFMPHIQPQVDTLKWFAFLHMDQRGLPEQYPHLEGMWVRYVPLIKYYKYEDDSVRIEFLPVAQLIVGGYPRTLLMADTSQPNPAVIEAVVENVVAEVDGAPVRNGQLHCTLGRRGQTLILQNGRQIDQSAYFTYDSAYATGTYIVRGRNKAAVSHYYQGVEVPEMGRPEPFIIDRAIQMEKVWLQQFPDRKLLH